MNLYPEQGELVASALIIEEGIKTAFWVEIEKIISKKRDDAILSSYSNLWHAGYAAAMVDLTKEIYGVVVIKNQLLAQSSEDKPSTEAPQTDEPTTHSTPQVLS